MITVTIRRDVCVGAGLCVVSAGKVFDQSDDDGLVLLLDDHPDDGQLEQVMAAANRCPSQAIRVERSAIEPE